MYRSDRGSPIKQSKCPFSNCEQSVKKPFIINIEQEVLSNTNFRTTPWTGECLQMTFLCIPPGCDTGAACHCDVDQFVCIVQGSGILELGDCKDRMCTKCKITAGEAFFIPARQWHNMINTGCCPLKLYAVYAPPNHPRGLVHRTKNDILL